ncbi:MAG: nitrogenase component 1, partial [Spirochaetia bacterium]
DQSRKGIPVIPVHSAGFAGSKKDGYRSACEAIMRLTGTDRETPVSKRSINILGDFNLAGETWIITDCYAGMGIEVVSCITGDGRVGEIGRSHRAALNVVQCSGSMLHLAQCMKEKYGIPFIRASYFGIEDMARALYDVARFFGGRDLLDATAALVRDRVTAILPEIEHIRRRLGGRRAAVYVGGAFKAFSLVKALRLLGMETVVVGSQTGRKEDYAYLMRICNEGTVIVDDANPLELARFILEKQADILIGGVKERPIAYKLGIAFCDHNHERKTPLAGFEGMLNFAREVCGSVTSPVWHYSPARSRTGGQAETRAAGQGRQTEERYEQQEEA